MQRAHNVVIKYLSRNAVRMKVPYDVKCNLTNYKPGDLVMYVMESGQLDVAPKLRINFQGSYLALDRLVDLNYWVQLDTRGKKKVIHHDKLNYYVGD